MNRPRWRRLALAAVVGATSMTLLVEPSHATPADPPSAAGPRVAKPKPPPPADAVDQSKGPRVTPKPKRDPTAATPSLGPWSVTLTASDNYPWPTRYTTLTATANQDVGPTPYYISIFDHYTWQYVAVCGSGTTCTVSLTHETPWLSPYTAFSDSPLRNPQANPPANVQASTHDAGWLEVRWRGVHVELSSSPSTLSLGEATTLTATTSRDDWPEAVDIGPSPFYIEIFDYAKGVRLGWCGWGSSCSVSVSQPEVGPQRYIAYLSNSSDAFPPTGLQATSPSARPIWTTDSFRVSLDVPRHSRNTNQVPVTATSNRDVGPTPYYIQIFNNVTGKRVAVCPQGTVCSTTVEIHWSFRGWHSFIAYVAPWTDQLDLVVPVASSNVADTAYTIPWHPVP